MDGWHHCLHFIIVNLSGIKWDWYSRQAERRKRCCISPAGKMNVFCAIFLLNRDISQLGHILEKLRFYDFTSQSHNCIPKYVSIVQFLPNSCLTFPAGSNYSIFHIFHFRDSCETKSGNNLIFKLYFLVFSLFSIVTFKNTGCKSQSTMTSGQRFVC